jgi:hypothetical protein
MAALQKSVTKVELWLRGETAKRLFNGQCPNYTSDSGQGAIESVGLYPNVEGISSFVKGTPNLKRIAIKLRMDCIFKSMFTPKDLRKNEKLPDFDWLIQLYELRRRKKNGSFCLL